MGVEAVGRTKAGQSAVGPDPVETLAIIFGIHDPMELPAMVRSELVAYCNEMAKLLHPLMRLSAMALNWEMKRLLGRISQRHLLHSALRITRRK